jgi:hypothetical protein
VGKDPKIAEEVTTMVSRRWVSPVGAIDARLLAAIGAVILLVGGVMWVVPRTPDSKSFTFDTARRGMSSARAIELSMPVEGKLVDGSDVDFYRIEPLHASYRLDVRMANASPNMIPALRIFDSTQNLVQEKTSEYLRQPGASIDASFLAQSNVAYFIQIFSQRNTTGSYMLTVTVRQP